MFFRVLLGSFESGVADRSGVAARMLHETCWGGRRRAKHCAFSCRVAAIGNEGYLVDGCSNDRFDVFFAAL